MTTARRPMICAAVSGSEPGVFLAGARDAADAGADLVEFRLDGLFDEDATEPGDRPGGAALAELVAGSVLPVIATIRAAYEGGAWSGSDADRVALYEALIGAAKPPRYVDVEYELFRRSPELRGRLIAALRRARGGGAVGGGNGGGEGGSGGREGVGLILSAHDFEGRPARLAMLLADMGAEPAASVVKIAYRARSLRDNLELFELAGSIGKPVVPLCMGPFGVPSRVLAAKAGALLTFASVRAASATAPGQPTVRELTDLYRFRELSPACDVFGVVGDPVEHSISPAVHNAAFEAIGRDAAYLRLPVPAGWEHLKATVLAMLDDPKLRLRGLSVTIPHKEHLLRLGSDMANAGDGWELDPLAEMVGAANTLTVLPGGRVLVSNTDVDGVLDPLAEAFGRDAPNSPAASAGPVGGASAAADGANPAFAGRRAVVLGAGGAGRAAAFALAHAGAAVLVLNRSNDRADELASAVNASLPPERTAAGPVAAAGPLHALEDPSPNWEKPDALIQCTPVGMSTGPEPAGSPLSDAALERLGDRCVVFETVYAPLETPLVRAAHERDLPVILGLEMFVRQAMAQAGQWSDRVPGRELFVRVARESVETAD